MICFGLFNLTRAKFLEVVSKYSFVVVSINLSIFEEVTSANSACEFK